MLLRALMGTLLLVGMAGSAARAADAAAEGREAIDKAIAYLKAQQQPDGSWQQNPRMPIALTALVLKAMAQDEKVGPQDAAVKKGFAWLASKQQDDGGIHGGMLNNYNTAIALSALVAAKDPAYKPAIDKAAEYLKKNQYQEGLDAKINADHPFYGGWGYGGRGGEGRPDVSNSAVVIEALKDAGVSKDDPAMQRAVKFLQRMQNNSETNPVAWAGNDGGFVYSVSANGKADSAAGQYEEDGKPRVRSYGSMTYAGLKSMIHAGLTKDDPRVKAAWEWVRRNWTVSENPGMAAAAPEQAQDGVFYYFQTMGKALGVNGDPVITDAQGKQHDWRVELIAELRKRQKPDGSFTGTQKWMENNPVLVTSFAVLALQDAVGDLKGNPTK